MSNFNSGFHSWSNLRGYGFLEFSDTCNPNNINKLPTTRLEPLSNDSKCTYLNEKSLTPKIQNTKLRNYLNKSCTKDLCIPSVENVVNCQGNQVLGKYRSVRTKCLKR